MKRVFFVLLFASLAVSALASSLANERLRVHEPVDRENPQLATAAGLPPQSGNRPPLREAFNADADKTRLVVLLSPT